MKKLILLFLFASGISQAQMPNIAKVWINDNIPYNGGFGKAKTLKISIESSEQNKQNDQEYIISGISSHLENSHKFEGHLLIKKYRDSKKGGKIFGEYGIEEENKKQNSGWYTGKFVFTFDWDEKLKQITNKKIEFKGKWTDYSTNLEQKTYWRN